MPKSSLTNNLRPFRDRDIVWYTPILPLLGAGFVYLMLLLAARVHHWLRLPDSFLPHAWGRNSVGCTITVVGLIFFTLGTGRSLLFIQKKRYKKFITTGVFKYTRNPSAFGLMSTLFGVSLIQDSLALFLIALVILIIFIVAIHFEDRIMHAMYGQEFLKYKSSTSRFVPSLNKLARNIFGLN